MSSPRLPGTVAESLILKNFAGAPPSVPVTTPPKASALTPKFVVVSSPRATLAFGVPLIASITSSLSFAASS